jgi:N-acetylmuramoyl-L-alanine amidase
MNNHFLSRSAAALCLGVVLIVLSLIAIQIAPAAAQTRSAAPSPAALTPASICFVSNGQTVCVDRPALSAAATITDEVRSLTLWLIAGPTGSEQAKGVASSLPAGTQLDRVSVIDQRVTIDLILPDAALKTLTDQQVEDINEQFRTTFTPYNFQRIEINARGSQGNSQLLSDFLPKIEIPRKPHPPTSFAPAYLSAPGSGEGELPLPSPETIFSVLGEGPGLRGKTVFVSAGHGWYWNTSFNTYRTQRPVYPSSPYPSGEGVVEDFNNAEAVNQYLLPYLQNAGADAWAVRERDMNTNMIIVDDGSAGFSTQGSWASNSGGYNGTYRSATTVNASPTATATWTFTPPTTATYAVYVRFPSAAITRTVDARFFVERAGAITPVTITQARDGNNWRFIGNYPFYGGRPARIYVTNQSATSGVTVLADAVRIGGGVADTSAPNTSVISGKPRWEEQAWTYAKWAGLPNIGTYNDVIVRPIYSEWEKEAGEDAVYISWHTNGYNGYNTVARGTESYIYLTPTARSVELQNFIHTSLLGEIHAGWEAGWPDRGQKRDNLGEVRMLSTMPGVLIENGFHDNPTDVEAMKDPRFLQLSARAIYHGLVHYWNSIDPNVPLVYLPEPPRQVIMRNSGAGQLTIAWQPGPTDGSGPLGDAATSYRVYTSTDGFGWSNPIDVAATSYTLTGLSSDQLIFAKVTGVNAGGESFASPVLAARTAPFGSAQMLIVYGFDRIDRLGDTQQNDPPEGYSRRVFVDRINRFDAIIQHAEVITLPFDSAQQAAVSSGSVGLGSYTIVDWIAGENQAPFPSLTTNDQTALTNFLNNGGALFISGSEIGYELKNTSFYANTLRASFVADDAQTYTANSTVGGIFNGLGAIYFDDGSHGMYDVDYADVIAPINGATSALVYNTAAAAVQYINGCTRLVYSGIPFETIYPRATRQAMMTRLMSFLGACLPVNTQITSPLDGAIVNAAPPFTGSADAHATQVQVSIRRVSDATFYNGSSFVTQPEIWLAAANVNPWSYALPPLNDGAYALRARAAASGSIVDLSPAAVTFTLDTVPPAVPTLITPTNGVSLTAVAPLFQWTGGGNPAGFHLQVDGLTTTLNSPALSTTRVVTDGPHQWRVRAFDAAGNLSSWSAIGTFNTTSLKAFLPLIMKNNEAPVSQVTCYEAIVNGGFESGDFTGWSRPSQNPPGAIITGSVYSGSYAARIGAATISDAISATSYSSIRQSITIPTTAVTATLSFARYRWSGDTAGDRQYLAVQRSGQPTDYLFSEGAADTTWNMIAFDLKNYAGQAINLLFSVMNNGLGGSSGMALDDVQAQICAPQLDGITLPVAAVE